MYLVYFLKRRGIMANNQKSASVKKDVAKSTSVAAATAAVDAKKTSTPVTAATSEPVKEKVVEKNEPAKKPGRRGRKAKAEVKAAKRTAKKKTEDRIQEVYFEFDGGRVEAGQIVKKVEEDYKAAGHQIGRIKDLKIYVKPEDKKAYYVINGNAEGASVDLAE
jgi:hypothetical protein